MQVWDMRFSSKESVKTGSIVNNWFPNLQSEDFLLQRKSLLAQSLNLQVHHNSGGLFGLLESCKRLVGSNEGPIETAKIPRVRVVPRRYVMTSDFPDPRSQCPTSQVPNDRRRFQPDCSLGTTSDTNSVNGSTEYDLANFTICLDRLRMDHRALQS